ncbi:MAG: hypothetical protein ABI700_10585, partial [Chloroflexota bacterium]
MPDKNVPSEPLLIECLHAYLHTGSITPAPDTDWCALIEKGYRQKVAPVVWTVLTHQPEVVPAEMWTTYNTWISNLRRKNSYFAFHLRRLLAI